MYRPLLPEAIPWNLIGLKKGKMHQHQANATSDYKRYNYGKMAHITQGGEHRNQLC